MYSLCIRSLAVLILMTSGVASAATLRAGSGCPYATPQLAFNAASANDIILIRSGNYPGPFTISKSIFVVGGYADCSSNTASGSTDFHGAAPSAGSTPLVTVQSTGLVLLQRLTLRNHINGSGNGGGLYVGNGSDVELDEVVIRNNFTSAGSGAAVYVDNATLRGAIGSSVVIRDNVAEYNGAGICARGTAAQLRFDTLPAARLDLIDNRVNNTGGQGSALLLEAGADAYLHDLNLQITSNLAPATLISMSSIGEASRLELRNSMLSGPSNTQAGIRANGGNTTVSIQDSTLQGLAPALSSNGGAVDVSRSTFSNNVSSDTGAAISISGDAQLQLDAVDFLNNSTQSGGGAIAVGGSASWVIRGSPARATRFIANTSLGSGGAILHRSSGSGSINPIGGARGLVEFQDNHAVSGGALFIEALGSNPQLDLGSPLRFSSNFASTDGGAIYAYGASLKLDAMPTEEVRFSANHATRDGGAIRSGAGSWPTLLAINSRAGAHGQVLFTERNSASRNGGAIAASDSGELSVYAPTIFENPGLLATASYDGGHVYVSAPTVIHFDGWNGSGRGIEFSGGYAGERGGGMFLVGVTGSIDWVQFGKSDAPNRYFNNGGGHLAIQGVGANVAVRNSSLRYGLAATSGGRGGAVLIENGALLRFESVPGIAGTPPAPGAAWPCQSSLLAAESHCAEITDNGTASTQGGAILVFAAQLELRGVSIDRNLGTPAALFVDSGASVDARNVRLSQHASGIKLASGAQMNAAHLTLAGTTGTALELSNSATTSMTLAGSIIWGNTSGIVKGAQAQLALDCTLSQTTGYGTLANPNFASSSRGMYRLGPGSAALDLCPASTVNIDLDGAARPLGVGYDAGAFEGLVAGDSLFGSGFE